MRISRIFTAFSSERAQSTVALTIKLKVCEKKRLGEPSSLDKEAIRRFGYLPALESTSTSPSSLRASNHS